MRRVVIMGPPGSGKSTLARQLGARYDLPVFHLDQAYWQAGWIETPPNRFRAEVERIATLPAWVIDGNYTATIGPRFRAADTVIYLDMPSWLVTLRIVRRMVTGYGRARSDSAPGCVERFDLGFLRFVWTWNRTWRAEKIALVHAFGGRKIVLHGRHAARPLQTGYLS